MISHPDLLHSDPRFNSRTCFSYMIRDEKTLAGGLLKNRRGMPNDIRPHIKEFLMGSYVLIKGTFHVVGYSPDGDSMMFKADKESLWKKLEVGSERACFQKFKENLREDKGAVQLRLLGIDALETHYNCNEKQFTQPTDVGMEAAQTFMRFLGVQKVKWSRHVVQKVTLKDGRDIEKKQADALPGYIVTSAVEDKGRPLVWVFAGTTQDRDGASWDENELVKHVAQSANYHLLKKGLVYPYFFESLPMSLQKKLAQAAKSAHDKAICIWSYDKSKNGWKMLTIKMITEETVIFPYLFRKIIKNTYKSGIPLDTVLKLDDLLKKEKFINEVIMMEKGVLRMKKQPWEILFQDSW